MEIRLKINWKSRQSQWKVNSESVENQEKIKSKSREHQEKIKSKSSYRAHGFDRIAAVGVPGSWEALARHKLIHRLAHISSNRPLAALDHAVWIQNSPFLIQNLSFLTKNSSILMQIATCLNRLDSRRRCTFPIQNRRRGRQQRISAGRSQSTSHRWARRNPDPQYRNHHCYHP